MQRIAKITTSRLALRKTAAAISVGRRAFPAWIDSVGAIPFPALVLVRASVTPRVRDSLVLRSVDSGKARRSRPFFDAPGGR